MRAKAAAATRETILGAARRLFPRHGFHTVSIEQIVSEANVTKGALYHHFEDKRALFLAVYYAVEIELSARAMPEPAPGEADDPWKRYRLRVQSFLDAILKAEFHRILLIDGPAVLGWPEWRQHESDYGLGSIARALQSAMTAKCIRELPVEPLAHLILAAITETALLIVNSLNQDAMRREAGSALDAFLAGLGQQA